MRGGLTLIESLVVTGIVGILASLLLPALGVAREAARRTQCRSRLHQLGLAAAAYESVHGALPPCFRLTYPEGTSFSPQCRLLPHLGLEPLFDSLNLDFALSEWNPPPEALRTAAGVAVAAFLCPSDGLAKGPRCSYRANFGRRVNTLRPDRAKDGAFGNLRTTVLASLMDGTSKTVLFSERVVGGEGAYDPFRDFWYLSFNRPTGFPSTDEECLDACGKWTPGEAYEARSGDSWMASSTRTTWYNHVFPPNSVTPDCAASYPEMFQGAFTARSFHSDSVNCVLADGSVQSIANSIDLAAWRALGTRAGND
jgi:prepilin-type N-terminal cleavage/methylation domain-containing protein